MEGKSFFVAPELDELYSHKAESANAEKDELKEMFFSKGDIGEISYSSKVKKSFAKESMIKTTKSTEKLSDEKEESQLERMNRLTERLRQSSLTVSASHQKVVTNTNPKERVIVRFSCPKKNIECDIDLPLNITSNDLFIGLNEAFQLGVDASDAQQCYLVCENPIALLKGKRTLEECGVRDGTLVLFAR